MGLFKQKPVKEIHDGLWGYLVNQHHIDVDTLGREIRCVEREGTINNGQPVKLVRVFNLNELSQARITVTGWETFDEHPELIIYEGYLRRDNVAVLEKKSIKT